MRSSGKLGDLEDQFSTDVNSVDHLICAGSVLQRKHIDQSYADQATINQMGDSPHRVPSSLPVDNRNGLAEGSPLGLLPIALDITVSGHCEDVDQAGRQAGAAPTPEARWRGLRRPRRHQRPQPTSRERLGLRLLYFIGPEGFTRTKYPR